MEGWRKGSSLTNIDCRGNDGGGGGGGYSRSTLNVTSGSTYFYAVGTGGNSNVAGGDSWPNTTSSALGARILAKGGTSASENEPAGNQTLGISDLASVGTGTIRFSGGDGQNRSGRFNGEGGSSAGNSADGETPANNNNRIIGAVAPAGGGSRRKGGVNFLGGSGARPSQNFLYGN